MGFLNSRSTVVGCIVISIWALSALGQTDSDFARHLVPTPATFSNQEFHCHTGYSVEQCQQDILQLKKVLTHYPVRALGRWTWVLVRSQDWKSISRRLQLNPDSPAFTALEPRETFLEEALFAHDPERTSELMHEWHRSIPELLELAVSHELGHAFCEDANEAGARRFGEELRIGMTPPCEVSNKRDTRKSSVAGETHPSKPSPFNVP